MSLINNDISYKPYYEYGKYEIIKRNNFRYYKIENQLVPSVTSILRLSRTNQTYTFSSRQSDSFEIGNLMHEYLDNYVTNKEILLESSKNSQIASDLSKVIIDNIFPKISSFIASEATVHDQCKYAGTLDLLANIDNNLTIIDYKSSYRKKNSFQVDEHFQQLAAYAIAHDNMYGTNIKQAMLFIAYKETYKYEVLKADEALFDKYKIMWRDKLKYYDEVSK
tara:strand:- start:2538 stop:3203 length:666 start_codon:yes stop_codon:yes gene_type:complete